MNAEKTEWVELQVTMPREIRDTIHEANRVLGGKASGWAREILLESLPGLVARAERRARGIQALFTHGKSTGSPRPLRAVKGGDAKRAKAAKAQGRKAHG